ncbi:MAG: hypothetical protein IPG23_13230 [Burkholderiales bacterium]|nr:hypothetical protein [Burkholderiales bacterium]
MAALLSPEELENHRIAHELVRLRLRLPIVTHLTQIHLKPLRLRWRTMHGESPPNGRLPESVRPFVTDPLSVAELSSFVAMYNRLVMGWPESYGFNVAPGVGDALSGGAR